MTKRMLIDATHAEETRVAVVDGKRLVDFDYESKVRKQLKGSIFLAKVTRVEPSLQAAFVNFGGNRHGFLPFSEIHPDYFRIPIADREALLAEQAAEMDALEEDDDEDQDDVSDSLPEGDTEDDDDDVDVEDVEELGGGVIPAEDISDESDEEKADDADGNRKESEGSDEDDDRGNRRNNNNRGRGGRGRGKGRGGRNRGRMPSRSRRVETVGGDDEGDRPARPSMRRNYKIQEVVKRGQIMLIQVSKEERGNKGAAVTTYLSLPGRYSVLMPNSARGGGVSRKIASFKERRRMKDILSDLKVPDGMSVIMRTAGVSRTKTEIKRDLDYLTRLWDNIRELTLKSTAPALINEEGNLIRRSIRDIYSRDIDEVLVAGADGYKFARDFMKMMIPSHVKRVKQFKDEKKPLFTQYQVESQIAEMSEPVVTLKSGGYLVINPTEALVSVDVNSGRATKERHIEETALKTNLEAAEEVARQLRLRDLGGLVVVDFIDMEDRRNNRKVENKIKEALSSDRARIQIGRISSFGLLEMSRQRLNPSLTEAQFEKCPHCRGLGHVRTIDSAAVTVLRALEDEAGRGNITEINLYISNAVALYILNKKRDMLADIEQRHEVSVQVLVDEALPPSGCRIEPLKGKGSSKTQDNDSDDSGDKKDDSNNEDDKSRDNNRGGRRRGRRGGRRRGRRSDGDRNNDQKKDDGESEKSKDTKSDNDKKDDEKSNNRRKPSRRKKSVKDDADKKSSSDKEKAKKPDTKDEKQEKKADNKKPKGQPKKRAAKKADKKSTKSQKEDSESAQAKKPSKEPSNDAEPKEYERVNEPPANKKKGWWNKLKD